MIVAHSPATDRGAASAPILRTELLSVRFGGLAALSQVNFEVAPGEIRAIIGPNGAGKSTFFNCLTGVLRPTSGRILFDGADIAAIAAGAAMTTDGGRGGAAARTANTAQGSIARESAVCEENGSHYTQRAGPANPTFATGFKHGEIQIVSPNTTGTADGLVC